MGEKLNKGLKIGLASAIGLTVTPAVSAYATTSEQAKPVDQNTEVNKEVPVANKEVQNEKNNDSITVGDYKEKPKEKIVVKKPKEQKQEKKQEVAKEENKGNKENKENKEIKPNSVPQPMVLASINQKDDLEVTIGKITGKQFGNIKPSKRGKDEPYYVPGKIFSDDIFATNDNPYGVVANGNTVTLNIPFSLRSKSGSLYKIKQITVKGNEQLRPINKSMDKKDISVEDTEIKNKYGLGNLNKITDNIMSTSTGSIQVNINVKGGWKTLDKIKANLVVTLENGEEKEVPLDIPEFLITNKIDSRVPIDLYLSKTAHANEWSMHPEISLDNSYTGQEYGTYDYIKGIEMKYRLTNDQFYFESKDPDIVVDNEKHTITFKGKYMMSTLTGSSDDFKGKLLLKVKGDIPPTGINCTIYPESCGDMIKWKSDPTYDMNITYYPHSSSVVAYPCGDWSIKQKCNSGYGYTKISDLGGKGKVTTVLVGSCYKDTVGLQCTRYFLNSVPANQKFYEFDASIVKNMKGRLTKEELDKILASKSYTAKELLDMLNNGDKIPIIGATSITKDFDGDTLNEINTKFINYKVGEGFYVGEYSIITSDDKNVVNNLHSFYSKENDVLLDNGILLRNNGKLFEKVMRYGSESEGFAEELMESNESSMEVDDCKVSSSKRFGGFYNQRTEVKKNWFRKPHVLHYVPCANVTKISTYSDIGPYVYKAGSTFTIDMGRKFKLNGTPKFRNHDLDYRIDGTKLILTVKKNINFESYSNTGSCTKIENGQIEIPFQYLEYDTTPLTITALTGSPYYAYFNNELHQQYPAEEVKNSFVVQNDNILSTGHIAGEDIDGVIDMHDYICNKEKDKQSYWVMSSCLKDNYNLATTNGRSNENVIESHITSFGDGLIYYLTKSKCTDKDLQLLRSNKLTQENIDYVKQHWIKYNRETLPNDVIAFVKNETVEGGASDEIYYLLAQKIKEGKSGFSQFKYLNSTSNTSSTSNIVEIKGPAIKHKVTVKAITTEGEVIMPETTVANKEVGTSLNFEDIVKFKIPPHYKCIRIENNGHESISSDDGLDLFSMFVKGFIPGMIGDSDDHVVFILAPETLNDSISGVDCITQDIYGHIIPNSKFKINGPFGTHVDTTKLKPVIPDNFKLVETKVNGSNISGVPNLNYTDHQQHIVYVVQRGRGSLSITVKSQDGKDMSRLNKNITDDAGNTYSPYISLPSGYKIVSVTLNGKDFNDNNPITFNTGHQDLVYTIKPIVSSSIYETIKIVDDNGVYQKDYESRKKLDSGKEGEVTYIFKKHIPEQFDLVKMTVNGKEVNYSDIHGSIRIDFTDKDQDIIYYVKPAVCNVDVKVISTDGKDFSYLNRSHTGLRGESYSVSVKRPDGYYVSKCTLNGEDYLEALGYKLQGKHDEVLYTLSPYVYSIKEKFVNSNNHKVLSPERTLTEGIKGTKINYNDPNRYKIPDDMICTKIEVNDEVVARDLYGLNIDSLIKSGVLPSVIKDDVKVTYYLSPAQLDIKDGGIKGYTYYSSDNTIVPNSKFNVIGKLGTKPDSNSIKAIVPEGYYITGIYLNKMKVSNLDSLIFDYGVNEINYCIDKKPRYIDIVYHSTDGKQFTQYNSEHKGYIHDSINNSNLEVPSGYKIVRKTLDGKEIKDDNPIPYTEKKQTIDVYLRPLGTGNVTVEYQLVDSNGNYIRTLESKNLPSKKEGSLDTFETQDSYRFYEVKSFEFLNKKYDKGNIPRAIRFDTPLGNIKAIYKVTDDNCEANVEVRSTLVGDVIPNLNHSETGELGADVPNCKFKVPENYKITKLTVDGETCDINTVPKFKEDLTNIIYYITPTDFTKVYKQVDIVDYNDVNNTISHYSERERLTDGRVSHTYDVEPLKDMSNYDRCGVSINGKYYNENELENSIKLKLIPNENNIVYKIRRKNLPAYVKVVSTDGKDFSNLNKTLHGYYGDRVTGYDVKIPNDYYIAKTEIPEGSKSIDQIIYENKPLIIKYTISPYPKYPITETVNLVDNEGKVLKVIENEKEIFKSYEKDNNVKVSPYEFDKSLYSIRNVIINGKEFTPNNYIENIPNKIIPDKQTIVYNLIKNPSSVTVKTVLENGELVGKEKVINGYVGDSVSIPSNETKIGYHLTKTMLDDKNVSKESVSSVTLNTKPSTVIYTLSANPKGSILRTVKIVDKNGNLVRIIEADKEIVSGLSETTVSVPSYDFDTNLYSLKSDELNGKSIENKSNDVKLTEGSQHQVITLVQNYGDINYKTLDDTTGKTVDKSTGTISSPRGTIRNLNGKQIVPTGYRLTDITLNGKKVNLSDLNNLKSEAQAKNVIFHVSKIYNATNQMVGTDGHVFSPVTVTSTGIKGENVISKELHIPDNYHLVRVEITNGQKSNTIKGNEFNINMIPKQFDNGNISVKYVVEINKGTAHCETIMEGSNTPIKGSVKDFEGITGTTMNGMTVLLPEGYQVKEIKLNGKTSTQEKINKLTYTTGATNVQYIVTPLPNNVIVETVNVVNEKGDVVRSLETDKQLATGYLGKKENISLYNFDKDMYSFKNMTVDGNNVPYADASLPKEIKDHAIRIVYNLTQNPSSVTVKTVDDKGQLVGEAKTINGFVGDKESIPSYNVKPGYHLEKTTLNGNITKAEDVSTITLKPTKSEIVYTLAPNAKGIIRETVNVLDREGHIIKTLENNKEIASGLSGLKTTVEPFNVDDMFYDLKDVTVNGVKSSNVPHEMTFTEKEQSIVINLNHKYGDIYVRTLMPDGSTVRDSNKSYNDLIGKKVDLIGAIVPKGYYVSRMYGSALEQGGCNVGTFDESYDYTGKPFENAIKSMFPGRLEQSVTYVLSKNPETKITRTVNVINPYTGKIVKTLEDNKTIATGSIDTNATISKYDFDNNLYELKNVTLNDKEIPNQNTSIVFKSEDQKEIVNLVQRKGTVTITTVDDKGNNIGENAVINTVIGDTPKVPESNKKIGYHLSKVAVNNKDVSTQESPKVTVSGNDKVVYTLSPNDTGVILETVNVLNKEGNLVKTLVSNKQVASGLSETKASVPVYSFDKNLYTKVSSKLNDKDYQEGTPITLTEKPQTIVITLKQSYGMINVKTIEKETQKTVANSERNIEGVVSENTTGINPVINPGYTLDSITINGKTATQNDVNKLSFKNEKQDVVYIVRKLPNNTITETVNVLSPTGQLVKTLESNKIIANDYLGHKENIDLYNYNKELYTLKNVTLNGKEISYDKSKLPTEITNSVQSIVYNLVQNQRTVTVTTKTTDGKMIGIPQKVTAVIGSNVKLNGYTPKEGYHLESITVNGNKVNSPVTDFTMSKNDTNIIYTIAPNEKGSIVRTVKVINPYTHEVAEVFENDKEIISGLSDTKQTLSKYHFNASRFDLVSNTLNGKSIENENQIVTLQKGVTHQIITLSQKPVKLTVSTVIGNKPVSEPEIIKAVIPSRLNIPKMKEVPGYHFEKANINRKEVRVVPNKLLLTGDVNIVYHLAPNAKSSVIRTVNVINPYTGKMVKTLINNETIATGLSGQTVNMTPYEFDKNLYELKSVTLNGVDYKETNSILLKDNTQKEVITLVQKKANVVTKTVLSNGTTIGKENRKEGIVGDIVKVPSYETLKGYHLDHITVNGNMEKNIPTTHKLMSNDTIIYTLSPNDKSTIRETINVINKEGRIIKVIENNKVISTGLIDTTYDWRFNNSIPNTSIKTIEINGNKIDTPSKTIVYTKDGSDIVITLQMKQATIKYKTIDESGNTISNSEGSSSIDIGSYMNMENKIVVPPNYKLTKILIDGKEATKESLKNVESVPNGRIVTFVVSKEKIKESLNSHKQPNIIINVENGNPITPPVKKEEKEIPPAKKEEKEIPPVEKKEEKERPRVIIKENKPAVKTEENPVVKTEELKETKPVNPIIIPTPKEVSKLEDTGLETNGIVEAEGVISGLALAGVFSRIFKKKNKK